ncbi:hypothetical protein JMUB7538_27050 [Staphylococcus aureus]
MFRNDYRFFKQKTAYGMSASLVGSEMCIRDRPVKENKFFFCEDLSLIHI